MKIEFVVYGDPKSLKRHRTTKTGHIYDPSAGEKQDFLAQALQYRPPELIRRAVRLTVKAYFSRPKGHYTKKGVLKSTELYVVKRPDSDNIIKFVADALNGIFWHDDCYIAEISFGKYYTGLPPHLLIHIETLT